MAKCAQEDGSAMFAPLTEAHVANFEHDRQGPIHVRIMSLSGKSPGIFWRANGVFQASSPTHSHLHSDRRQCDFTVDEHTKPPSLCLLQHGNMATWQHGYTATRQHVQLAGVDRPAERNSSRRAHSDNIEARLSIANSPAQCRSSPGYGRHRLLLQQAFPSRPSKRASRRREWTRCCSIAPFLR